MTSATLEKAQKAPVKATWGALIYLPGIESDKRTAAQRRRGRRVNIMDIPMRHFTYFLPLPENHPVGTPIPSRSFHAHPGTNMGVHIRNNGKEIIERLPVEDWEAVAKQPINASLIEMGALEFITPAFPDDDGEPGYRHFSQEDALKLIEFHEHQFWVDRALIGETRAAVLTAAERRKREIIEEQIALQAGD